MSNDLTKTDMTLRTYLPMAVAALMLAGCSNCKKCGDQKGCQEMTCSKTKADRSVTYTGVLPAADAGGIEYTLVLDYDDDGKGGGYSLTECYIGKVNGTFTSKGDFTVNRVSSKNTGKKYLRLIPDHPSNPAVPQDDILYFLVDDESTITLTDSTLKPFDTDLNYSLTRK